jgi:hypothetical protein
MPNWKKVIVSGSSAHLNHVTASGNISGSSTSTGSFGRVDVAGNIVPLTAVTYDLGSADRPWKSLHLLDSSVNFYSGAGPGNKTGTIGNDPDTGFAFTDASGNPATGSFGEVTASGNVKFQNKVTQEFNTLSAQGDPIFTWKRSGNTLFTIKENAILSGSVTSLGSFGTIFADSASFGRTSVNIDGVGGHITASGHISGSSTSTGSFGHLVIDKDAHIGEDVLADGDVVAYNSSDIRLKDNLQVIKGSLDKIGEINGYEFDWNEESPGWARERGHDIGVIAQEVQKVVPEIVVERKNGYLGVDYKRLVPLLIESVKELKQEIEILKKKVN